MILHHFELSADCYAVRLLAALTATPLTLRAVDVYPGRENESAAFLALNPSGTVPVLEDGPLVLADWLEVLKHLATRGASGQWWPRADAGMREWLAFARDLAQSAGAARLHDGMGYPVDIVRCRAQAHTLLRRLDRHLWCAQRAGHGWILPGNLPSAADVAVFAHAALCEEGGVSRMDYPAVRRWIDRVRHLPGFIVTSGVFAPA